MSLLARVMFYPSLGYNVVLSKISSRNWYDRVDDTVIIGALPLKNVAQKLIEEENVKAVVSVNESYELKHLTFSKKEWKELGVDRLHLSAVDLTGTLSQKQLVKGVGFIMSHRRKGESVYVHCKAGRTRSATVVMCYLMQANDWGPEMSFDLLKKSRPHIWLREKQWNSIKHFYDILKQKPQKQQKQQKQ